MIKPIRYEPIDSPKIKISKFNPELLPPPKNPAKPTLVLDLDETLIFAQLDQSTLTLQKRPGLESFLASTSKNYELVIFTASTKDYADTILSQISNTHLIDHRLYWEHVTQLNRESYLTESEMADVSEGGPTPQKP